MTTSVIVALPGDGLSARGLCYKNPAFWGLNERGSKQKPSSFVARGEADTKGMPKHIREAMEELL